jgi:hypothetical protein
LSVDCQSCVTSGFVAKKSDLELETQAASGEF